MSISITGPDLSVQIRDAVEASRAAGEPGTRIVAHVEVGRIPAAYLSLLTTAPSGKEYAAVRLADAEAWLQSLGVKLVQDNSGRQLFTYTVDVEVSGSHMVTVDAYDEDEAVEFALEMARDEFMDLEYDARIVASDEVKRGAA